MRDTDMARRSTDIMPLRAARVFDWRRFGWRHPRRTREDWLALSKMLGAPVHVTPAESQTAWDPDERPFTIEQLLSTPGPVIAELPALGFEAPAGR